MKNNYIIYIGLIPIILFRGVFFNILNNFSNIFFEKTNLTEAKLLEEKNKYLKEEYNLLLDFKNNINLTQDYIITNTLKTNYGFGDLIISGNNYQIGDEVVNAKGLVGIISEVGVINSTVKVIHNTNLVVKINNETGKISSTNNDNNLIIKEISNYNSIQINDLVYSVKGN